MIYQLSELNTVPGVGWSSDQEGGHRQTSKEKDFCPKTDFISKKSFNSIPYTTEYKGH